MSLNVKKGDNVVILTGKDQGKTGKVISASPRTGRVVVDGANEITKHVKARSANEQSRIEKKNGTIDASSAYSITENTRANFFRYIDTDANGVEIKRYYRCA